MLSKKCTHTVPLCIDTAYLSNNILYSTRDLEITYPVCLCICNSSEAFRLSCTCIGRYGFILLNHDISEEGFSAPEMKCSLMIGIKSFISEL